MHTHLRPLENTSDGGQELPWCDLVSDPLTIAFPRAETGRKVNPIERLLQLRTSEKWKSGRIAIKAKGRVLLVDSVDVFVVEAKDGHVVLHRASSSHILRESMTTMEEKLNPHGFVRIHRSVLVNGALVEEIQPRPAGESLVRMKGGKEYTVTRTYKKNLQALAQSWIGMDGFIAE